MAFKSQDLSVLAYANGFTLWHYKTDDYHSVIDTLGYFNDAFEMLQVGDLIVANVKYNSATAMMGLYFVRYNTDGVVDVSNTFGFGHSNSD